MKTRLILASVMLALFAESRVVRKQADGSWLFIVDNPYAAASWDACPSC